MLNKKIIQVIINLPHSRFSNSSTSSSKKKYSMNKYRFGLDWFGFHAANRKPNRTGRLFYKMVQTYPKIIGFFLVFGFFGSVFGFFFGLIGFEHP